ncbi:hypothetical protein I546_3841 [Mycobacterium kansasii 732]|uniref:Uncharacterized protein n=1 Tax=Mycobacterium kansasii TaxID=1768 RepID=A0A1V3X3M5_MYCKA|nr:hypothetical protein I546_3841 [Mycobacterium kansasii 732]OOK73874.1 hypothetical protein BZL30_5064 [Mycobacterium kansasii]
MAFPFHGLRGSRAPVTQPNIARVANTHQSDGMSTALADDNVLG